MGVSSGVQGPPGVRGLGCFLTETSSRPLPRRGPAVDQGLRQCLPWPPGTLSAGLGQCRDELQRPEDTEEHGTGSTAGGRDRGRGGPSGRLPGARARLAGRWGLALPSPQCDLRHSGSLLWASEKWASESHSLLTQSPEPRSGNTTWRCQVPAGSRLESGLQEAFPAGGAVFQGTSLEEGLAQVLQQTRF